MTQVINQINIQHPGKGKGKKDRSETWQDAYQGALVSGKDNQVVQDASQTNINQRGRKKGQTSFEERHENR